MELAELLKELEERDSYKQFKKENPESFFCAAFIVLSDEGDKVNLDFFIPSKNKMASFEYPFNSFKIHEDEIKEAKEQKVEISLGIDNLKSKVEEILEIKNRNMKCSKIIAILKDNVWNLTCLGSALQLIRLKIDANSEKELDFNSGNLMDMAKFKKTS